MCRGERCSIDAIILACTQFVGLKFNRGSELPVWRAVLRFPFYRLEPLHVSECANAQVPSWKSKALAALVDRPQWPIRQTI